MDWYEENIEEPIRPLVRFLRNNGINTECSCGHDMYVQCEFIPDGEIKRLHELLWTYFSENSLPVNFTIYVHHAVMNGHSYTHLDIFVNDHRDEIARLIKEKNYIEHRIKEFSNEKELSNV